MYPQSFLSEIKLRASKICNLLKATNIDAILISDNANLYYTSGRVFGGYTYITEKGEIIYFVKRPVGLTGNNIVYIRKPEQITDELLKIGIALPKNLALELDTATYSEIKRFENIFPNAKISNGSAIMRQARAVKTDYELLKLKESGVHHDATYHHIKSIYREGMTDVELQIEIERKLRLEGSLGQFRISGNSMEIFMGNILCGNNADTPSPYDFAMGGAGQSLSLPVGCNGTEIRHGMAIMIDMGGNFNGYMTDMTRVFSVGDIGELAHKAHALSIDIHKELSTFAHDGVAASEIYNHTIDMVKSAGLDDYFMGHNQKASFIGHGIGIEINELPVLAPRSKDILQAGNVIAIEPKFVIPTVGAVGVESTYIVRKNMLEKITNFPEEIVELY
ncbi:MAG: Xaa-Pro peptidase family protein [Muribaculaceae bacterium]